MSIRLKLALSYMLILAASFMVMGFLILEFQQTNMIRNLKGELEKTSIRVLGQLENPNPGPAGPYMNPQNPGNVSSDNSASASDEAEPGNVGSSGNLAYPTLPSPGQKENFPPMPSGPREGNPPDSKPFDQRSPEEFDQIFQNGQGKTFDVINILDTDENLIYNPIQRNSTTIPITSESKKILEKGSSVWQTSYVDGVPFYTRISPIEQNDQLSGYLQVARPLSTINEFLNSLLKIILITSISTIIVSTLAGWFLAGLSLNKVDQITQTANEIREEQDFSKRVTYSGPHDEIGRLAEAFNSMLDNVQASYERLSNSLVQQRNFVADVSHELRTPLTTIRGNLALLVSDKQIPEEDKKEIVHDCAAESERMINLVNNLLTLARADIEEKLYLEPVKVRPIIDESLRMLTVLDPERTVQVDIPDDLEIMSEPTKLKQVLIVLIDNAYKHSKTDIQIKSEQGNDWTSISVIDHGEGIAKEDLEKIFERFSRGSNSRSGTGYGLGLPIARALSKSLNGKIEVQSEPNVETCFKLIINKPKTEENESAV